MVKDWKHNSDELFPDDLFICDSSQFYIHKKHTQRRIEQAVIMNIFNFDDFFKTV